MSCAKTEALLPKKNGNGAGPLAVKDAEAWGRAALMEEPVPDVAAMAREKRKERRRSKGDKADAKRAAAKKKKEARRPNFTHGGGSKVGAPRFPHRNEEEPDHRP